jgi:hypothetical protein
MSVLKLSEFCLYLTMTWQMFSRRGNWIPFRPAGENWSSEQYCIWPLLYEMNAKELEAKGENFIDNLQKVSRRPKQWAVYIINLDGKKKRWSPCGWTFPSSTSSQEQTYCPSALNK